MDRPEGVAVDRTGNVYAADGVGQITVLMKSSQQAAQLRPAGIGQPQGVAVDRGGNLYLADLGNRQIIELQI